MTLPGTHITATPDAEELAAIVRNARLLGIPAWRVATALGIPADRFAQVQALVPGDGPRALGNQG